VGSDGECEWDRGGDGDDDELWVTFCANWDIFARGVGAVIVALE
jgi:hypothetical protein